MKKVVRILLAILMVMCLTLGITACKSECEKGNHVWETEGTVTTPATCTAKGVRTYKCTLCDETKTEAIDMIDHKPVDASVPATCTTAGTTGATKCSVCGTSIAAGTTIPAKGHTVTTWTPCADDDTKHEGTCTVDGCGVKVTEAHKPNEAGDECTKCHATLGGGDVTPCEHDFDATIETNITIVKPATCTENGSKTVKCSKCGVASEPIVIPALDHDKYVKSETAATCTTDKIEHWACHRCDDWTENKTVTGTALDHDWEGANWTPCADNTTKHERACQREGCNYVETESHKSVKVDGVAATCTTEGKGEGRKCSVCDYVITEGATISALKHDYTDVDWTLSTTDANKHERTCTREGCGYVDVQDHTWDTEEWANDSTKHWHDCTKCEAVKDEDDHDFGDEGRDLACNVCDEVNPSSEFNYVVVYTLDGERVRVGYVKLADALDALAENENVHSATISVRGDGEGKTLNGFGVVIPEGHNITIDLNGATYVVASNPVGSTGTETNGFQILKNSNVTIKDGTITSAEGSGVKMLIQNYANLTLDGVTLNGTYLDGEGIKYTLSNNCGTVVIKNKSKIIAKTANDVAFDAYYNLGGNYPQGVNVDVDDSCKITGMIAYGSAQANVADLATKAVITLTTGTYKFYFTNNVTDCTATGITIDGETLTHKPSQTLTHELVGDVHKHYATCSLCSSKIYSNCTWDDGVVTREPTCEGKGVMTYTCDDCGYSYTEEIAAIGHKYATSYSTDATTGKHYQACLNSGCNSRKDEHTPDMQATTTATCTAAGTKTSTCQHDGCNVTVTEDDAALGHNVTSMTYDSEGKHSGECARCGETIKEACDTEGANGACSACGRIILKESVNKTITIDFSKKWSSNTTKLDMVEDIIKLEFADNKGTVPQYYTNGTAVRMYDKNTLTVTVTGSIITEITFTFDGSYKNLIYVSGGGSLDSDTATWSNGNDGSKSIVFKADGGQARIQTIEITYKVEKTCYHDGTVESCAQSAATCTTTGILKNCFHCTNCDLYFTTDACTEILENAVVDALGHNYGEWIAEVAATCASTGTKGHFYCNACGGNFDTAESGYAVLDSLTIAINPNNHTHLAEVTAQDPTCNNAGWHAHYVCDGCGKKYQTADATEEYDPAIAALGHDLAYRANGTDKHEQYCTRCDYVEDAEAHTATTWVSETDGHHQVCTVCGLDFNEGTHAYTDGHCVCGLEEAHEHNYTGTVTKQPTCTEKGVTTYTCDGCDNTYTEDIDALGHDFTGDVLPITDDNNHHAQKCSRCDAFDVDKKAQCDYTEETVDADGHHIACVCGRIDSSTPHEYVAATQTCSCGKINPAYLVVAGTDQTVATFAMGTGTGTNNTGSNSATYSETAGSYTLDITRVSGSMYINAGDGTNNVLRLATSGNSASLSFEVPNNVTKVVIYVARYNGGKAVQLTINGANVDSPTGTAYIPVTVDTTEVKTIVLGTNNYCYIDKIEYWAKGQDYVADPDQTPSVTAADCTNAGKVSFYCTTAGCTTLHEVAIPALGHNYGEWIDEVAATCTTTGTKGHFYCNVCGGNFDSEENDYAVLDDLTIAIDPNNHTGDLTHVDAQTATTCDTTDTEHAGHVEYWQCACGVMYADDSRNTVIDSLEPLYLDHTPNWTTKTDSGHSGKCSECDADIDEQQHVWNDENTACTICGYEKPTDKNYVTTVIIVDGTAVDGIPAGVTLTWDPADTNGAFDAGETVTLEISLSGYNLVSVAIADSTGNESEDWFEESGAYMGEMNDDYTVTITLETLYTITVNNENNATLAWYDENGETATALTSATQGTKFNLGVTAKGTVTVKVGNTTVVAGEDGLYAFEVGTADLTIDITVELNEQTATYQFGATDTGSTSAASNANVATKFENALKSGDTNVVSSVSASNVFTSTANTDNLKFGSSKNSGSLKLTFDSTVKVTKIVITAKQYSTDSSAINVDGNNSETLTSTATEYEFELNGEESVTINITGKRGYIDSIVVYYE